MSELHTAALQYAEDGIPVFPCAPLGKHPICTNGHSDATTDVDYINEWWTETPDANIGTVPGKCGWAVIDIDPPDGEVTWAALQEKHGAAPETFTVISPRGGRHLFFTGHLPPTVGKSGLGPHVDTRGDDSYVLLSPSTTPDGTYAEATPGLNTAPLPAWIEGVIAERKAAHKPITEAPEHELDAPYAVSRATAYLKNLEPLVKGFGADLGTYNAACRLKDFGISQELCLALLDEHLDCTPQDEGYQAFLERKVENAYRYGQNVPGAQVILPGSEVFTRFSSKLEASPEPEVAERSRFHFEDEAEQDAGKDTEWLVKQLIPDEATVLCVGESGSFKSFLALDIALSLATPVGGGTKHWACVRQGPVFYASLEGTTDIKTRRRRAWKIARGITGVPDFYVGRAPLVSRDEECLEFAQQVSDRCAGRRPAMIIVDTLAKSMVGLEENSAKDTGLFVHWCNGLAELFHCPVFVLHHKGKHDKGTGGRGSSALVAGFDTIIDVSRHDMHDTAVTMRVLQHKDAEEPSQPWRFIGKRVAGSLVFDVVSREDYEAHIGKNDPLSAGRVIAALRKLFATETSKAVVTQVLAEELTPMSEDDTPDQLNEMVTNTRMALTKLARTKLSDYCRKVGRDYFWSVPNEVSPQ